MADPVVSVAPARVVVEPGGQAPVTVTVRNTGQLVEGFHLTVHGAAAEWAEVVATGETEPGQQDVVRVYPGKEGTATVVFAAPPVSAGLTGEVPFCVLAQSVVDASSSAAAEGDLEIGRVDGLTASITPVTSSGRWSGRHTVKISNWGNAPATLRLTASDPDEALGFLVHPEHLRLPVGASAVAALRVRSRRPFLRGTPVRLPFRVVAEPDPTAGAPGTALRAAGPPVAVPTVSDPGRPVLDGALDQRPVLSKSMVLAAALAVMGAAAGVVMLVTADTAPAAEREVDTAAPVPRELTAETAGDTSIVLAWAQLPVQVDDIRVFRVKPGTEGQPIPVLQHDETIPGDRREHMVEKLKPATRYCFQIVAVRGEKQSLRSEAVCQSTAESPAAATTPGNSGTATTSPPAETSPSSSGSSGSETSAPTTGSEGSTTTTDTGSPSTDSATTTPGTVAPGGGQGGATPTPTPTSTGPEDFGESWVVGRLVVPGTPTEQVEEREAELTAALAAAGRTDLAVGRLDSDLYEGLGVQPGWVLVYVGKFDSREAAESACPDLGLKPSACQPRQPGKPKDSE
ncbi:fibronectin type III domain-containing protein [Modestobacter sp. URMC 112]